MCGDRSSDEEPRTGRSGRDDTREDTQPVAGYSQRESDGPTERPHAQEDAAPLPERIGRFVIRQRLGKGGHGEVYLARDEQLDRAVAIKVPRPDHFSSRSEAERYVSEARMAAGLQHPSIVAVYDVSTAEEAVFIVLEYIPGQALSEVLRQRPIDPIRAVDVMMQIGDAVGYAHEHGLVHRDLKPSNILMDGEGRAHVADFGLAVHEKAQQLLRGEVVGTPFYMAPELIRGETHRLDGRTDIWSLGVILYEMLTGRRPFSGEARQGLFDEILHREAKPLRQINRKIPKELGRICMRCLSKRMADRYPTALDLVDDLRRWREELPTTVTTPTGYDSQEGSTTEVATVSGATEFAKLQAPVIPKGLRSFDARDADFFLDLLPGPYDREGLPESVRFWKTRIEETDPEETFTVGLLYGSSGCGKSSLVKAGLIPRLAKHVHPVYIEATSGGTESLLERALRRVCPNASDGDSLISLMLMIREGSALPRDDKVIIVLDQCEQWLHANRAEPASPLVQALRHCDGRSLQCLLLVRDGFGMSAMRLMNALEIPVVEGENYATVDNFDLQHAENVLAHFGRAFERLPEDGSCADQQERFLREAVAGLAEDGRVVPVRLALFAEMFRGKPWNLDSLKKVGGPEGIGVTFLEETLGDGTANPKHQLHGRAIRRVLKAMLPEPGSDIRQHTVSQRELLDLSRYSTRPSHFDDLIRILDRELRLITPSDPEEGWIEQGPQDGPGDREPPERRYQLTHDYLVPPLRDWLSRKLRETPRGRAALVLQSQAELWNARPERRYLPSLIEWATALLLTRRSERTQVEQKMMRAATRFHSLRIVTVAVLGIVALTIAVTIKSRADREAETFRNALVQELQTTKIEHVEAVLKKLDLQRDLWLDQLEQLAYDESRLADLRTRAHLALGYRDAASVPYLIDRLYESGPDGREYRVLFSVLKKHQKDVRDSLLPELTPPAPHVSDSEKERLAKREAIAVLTLARLGSPEYLWERLAPAEDPRLRTLLIHRMHPYGVDGKTLMHRLDIEEGCSVRQAILLGLEAYRHDGLSAGDRHQLVKTCCSLYRSASDPGVRAGAEWLLRSWGHEPELANVHQELAGKSGENWLVTQELHTMIVIRGLRRPGRPGPQVGRPQAEDVDGPPVEHTYALSAHEVTIEQFQKFDSDLEYAEDVTTDPRCPANNVTWYDAARYCRWLSEQEGLSEEEMCYPPVDEVKPGMSLPDDFFSRTGYRLPAPEEWEFAARAGTVTSRFFGDSAEMLPEYAWYTANSQFRLHVIGMLKPNPMGLFDIYGNVFEWCDRRIGEEGALAPDGSEQQVACGGAYRYPARDATSDANRGTFNANTEASLLGFRVARTIRE